MLNTHKNSLLTSGLMLLLGVLMAILVAVLVGIAVISLRSSHDTNSESWWQSSKIASAVLYINGQTLPDAHEDLFFEQAQFEKPALTTVHFQSEPAQLSPEELKAEQSIQAQELFEQQELAKAKQAQVKLLQQQREQEKRAQQQREQEKLAQQQREQEKRAQQQREQEKLAQQQREQETLELELREQKQRIKDSLALEAKEREDRTPIFATAKQPQPSKPMNTFAMSQKTPAVTAPKIRDNIQVQPIRSKPLKFTAGSSPQPLAQDRFGFEQPTSEFADSSIKRFILTSELEQLEPVDYLGNKVPVKAYQGRRIYWFNQIVGANGQTMYHSWYFKGMLMSRIAVRVRSNNWRASTYKTVYANQQGDWKVVTETETERALVTHKFNVQMQP